MPRPVEANATYLPGLDGVRALAVTFVVVYHLGWPAAKGGLAGVGVFFTLSGFLITSLLLGHRERTGDWGLGTFWLRRFRRLVPAVLLVLAAVLIGTALTDSRRLGERALESLSALFYVNNWHTIAADRSYFDRFEAPSPLSHMWSLSIEEQFYVVWPIALIGLFAVLRRRWLVTAVVLLLAAGSFTLLSLLAEPGFDNTRAYEGTDTRAGGLLLGAALALWWPAKAHHWMPAVWRRALDAAAFAGLAVILGLVTLLPGTSLSLYSWGLLTLTVATLPVLAAAVVPRSATAAVLGCAPLRWIGERSYGIYLWHLPVIAFMPATFVATQRPVASVIAVVLTGVLATLSWRYVENPIRRYGLRGAFRGREKEPNPVLARIADALIVRLERLKQPRRRLGVRALAATAAVLAVATGALVAVRAVNPDLPIVRVFANTPGEDGSGDLVDDPKPTTDRVGPTLPPEQRRTSCTSVVHIGDSTSVGLMDAEELPDPATRVDARYRGVGATTVTTDIAGARSSLETVNGEPNAVDSITSDRGRGAAGCWVMAMGLNDTANIEVGGPGSLDMRIDRLMNAIGDQPVLWPTIRTTALNLNPAYDNAAMTRFNKTLLGACKRYPNLRIYDWAAEAQPSWFAEDGIHYTQLGYTERGRRMAVALATAYPLTDAKPAGCVVRTDK